MEKLDNLYQWLHDEGVVLTQREFSFSNSRTKAATIELKAYGLWGVFIDISRIESTAEEYAVMLHESGHYATGTTHEVCSPFDLVEKHEYKADKWAIQQAFTADDLDEAVADGYDDIWALADYFNVPVAFMRKAVCWYVHGNMDVKDYMTF